MTKNYLVRTYQKEDYQLWNAFITKAANTSFLFHRDFMEYHADRFSDFSLLFFENTTLKAVLPAHRREEVLYSHQGLTFGGFVFEEIPSVNTTEIIIEHFLAFLKANGIRSFEWKQLPDFYKSVPDAAIDYFLFQKGATVYQKELNLTVNLNQYTVASGKMKHFRKSSKHAFEIRVEHSGDAFWNEILEPRLLERFNAKPVHSLEEINRLMLLFPDTIVQMNVYHSNTIVAGMTLFINDFVVKSQYGATSSVGESLRALDYLYICLLEHYQKEGKRFFDMGTVTKDNGTDYNPGLATQKEELGSRVYVQNYIRLDLND